MLTHVCIQKTKYYQIEYYWFGFYRINLDSINDIELYMLELKCIRNIIYTNMNWFNSKV